MTLPHNLVMDTDSYKASHWLQYPPGTTSMLSYLESRGGEYKQTVFFGLQYILKAYFSKPITEQEVLDAHEFFMKHGEPFNLAGWLHIVNVHGGKLPVRIRAVAEGTVVPVLNCLMTVESTDPECFWIVSWLETMLMRLWYPITVATQSYYIKKLIYSYLKKTSDNPDAEIGFKLHDFGSRGVSSAESAGIGGMAHLINFLGSDTVEGVRYANHYYKSDMAAFSIPAAEHSTITAWGKENEEAAYRNMLLQYAKPGKLVAVVSDSYDIFNAVSNLWCGPLLDEVKASGATLVIRPDSGDPATVVLQVIQAIEEKVGCTVNSKGFKVLPDYFRVIQGDGIELKSIKKILSTLKKNGYSASNIAFGMGGALLQKVNRDTQKFAFKCCHMTINGESVDIFKDPVTDPGKKSKRGRLALIHNKILKKTTFETLLEHPSMPDEMNLLKTVFLNGEIVLETTMDQVRAQTQAKLPK